MLPHSIVVVRRCRWRVVSVERFEACAVVTLHGIASPCAGVEQRFIEPFDRLVPAAPVGRPLRVSPGAWRRACRAVLAADVPPNGLRAPRPARIDLLPYELEPALAVVRGLGCRILLADEVGLGKTVQAGLVAAELRARGAVERVLVLTPAGLRDQWRAELHDRFALQPRIVDASAVREAAATLPPDVDPWATIDIAIASIDYIKRPDVLAGAARRPWDLVIVDEAHGAASDSDRRAAVDALCARAVYVVLLTATPHNGDADAFSSLCRLGRVADDRLLVFRRTRRDASVSSRRRTRILRIRPTAAERRLHAALRQFSDAVVAERPNAWLALSVLHKRALSSAAALATSIDRRLAVLDAPSTLDEAAAQLTLPLDGTGDRTQEDEPPRWDEQVALTNVDRERRLLRALAEAARGAARRESKVQAIARLLRRIHEPVLVFTEYRDTLSHVRRALRRRTIALHGGLTREERCAAVDAFVATPDAVMLATDAAGEGLNLQAACRIVVNLELPWNPLRLEQRIGRVDRIGQRRTVHAIHLVARGAGETALLKRLQLRLARAGAVIGAPDPFGAREERAAAELVVLRRTPIDVEPTPNAAASNSWSPDLTEIARDEAARLAAARQLANGIAEDPVRPWAIRAGARLKRLLRGRRLEIWRCSADAERGHRVESTLFGVLISASVRPEDVERAVAEAAGPWRDLVARSAAAFSAARLQRSVSVMTFDDRARHDTGQPTLFADRRRVRERVLTEAEQIGRRALLERRVADAAAAGSLVYRPPELLFVVLPR